MKTTAIVRCAAIVGASLASGLPVASAHANSVMQPGNDHRQWELVPTLSVRGHADLEVDPDQVTITFAVVTQNQEAQAALDENTERMNAVVAAIKEAGIADAEIRTGRFSINPQYSQPPRQYREDWKAEIVGYQVTNRIVVETRRLDLTGGLLQAAVGAGVNSIDSVSWGLADPRSFRTQAIRQATERAQADAAALAEAAGVQLVEIIKLGLDEAQWSPPIPLSYARAEMDMMVAKSAPPPVFPEKVTVTASVTIEYRIDDQ